ncbi:MAG: hypothetical protein K9J17_11430 [Flavobacteriales bacterium]|nr:hypothetical protein [Flavobacteriales bacterium]
MFSDKISQRILASFIGGSTLLLSASLLLFSMQYISTVNAEELDLEGAKMWDQTLRGGVGLGIKDNVGYFVVWGDPNKFYKVELNKATDWYSE